MRIVCLANSFREGGRCLAGIELDTDNQPIFVNNRPKWVRPVGRTAHEEVPTALVSDIFLLDIFELAPVEFHHFGHQTENLTFHPDSLVKTGKFDRHHLWMLTENEKHNSVFGSTGRSVALDVLKGMNYSLKMIYTDKFAVVEKEVKEKFYTQVRIAFDFHGVGYEFPVTDPIFLYEYRTDKNILNGKKHLYLTISLAAPFENLSYKLIAGVIH